MHRAMIIAAALALGSTGCSPATTFSARGAACPSRPGDCEVVVITRRPERDFQVVGVFDIESFSVKSIPNDEASFLALMRPEVCRVGGDAVIPGQNRDGRYVLATVVKWVEEGSTEPACVADAGAPDAEAAAEEEPAADQVQSPPAEEAPAPDEVPAPAETTPAAPADAPADAPVPQGDASSPTSCAGGAPC